MHFTDFFARTMLSALDQEAEGKTQTRRAKWATLFPRLFRQSHGNEVGQVSPLQLVIHLVQNTSKYSGQDKQRDKSIYNGDKSVSVFV